jgi:hypothetical protein
MTTETEEDSNLVKHAMRELDAIGMTEEKDGIDKLGREGVLELVRLFASQGHSGSSGAWMLGIVEKLLRFEPLTPLTNHEEEWILIHEGISGEPDGLWQNCRDSRAFSKDGGKTYTLVDDPKTVHTSEAAF